MRPDIIAMYLPQFHQIPENDAWWGTGFTEWTTVKAAKPLFKGHEQPVVPANGNYYDLMDPSTMEWQIGLMDEYGVYGMCIYHYWFKGGRQILERPAEMLLADKSLDTRYCFCWANESWLRSWSNFGEGNVWAGRFETRPDYQDGGILLEQQYGAQRDWREHFDYLLPFFRDERYIKHEGCPVFLIYRPSLILTLEEMADCWRRWAVEVGFQGMYFIFANCDEASRRVADRELYHEPQRTFHRLPAMREDGMPVERAYSYDRVTETSLADLSAGDGTVCYGGFVGYDDTPRRGERGSLIYGATPERFRAYMERLLRKNEAAGSPYLFLNAWNEWGEGMYLEPDEKNGDGYLAALKEALDAYGRIGGQGPVSRIAPQGGTGPLDPSPPAPQREGAAVSGAERYEQLYRNAQKQAEVLHFWLLKKEMGRSMSRYLLSLGCKRAAVYGLGILGKHFITELRDGPIELVCAIDRSLQATVNGDIPLVGIDRLPDGLDAVVVTVPHCFAEIKKELERYTAVKIVSIEQIVMEC